MNWLVLCGLLWAGAQEDLNLAANPNVSEELRMDAFNRLVQIGATDLNLIRDTAVSTDEELRKRWVSIRILGKVGGAPAREILPPLSVDPDPAIRAAALSALGDLGTSDFVDIIQIRLKDEAIIVRAAAAEALGKIKDPQAIPSLSKALQASDARYRGASLWVRRHYVEALRDIGSIDAYPALLRSLYDDDPTVVQATILALENIAGFDFKEGRDLDAQKEAWRRWLQAQLGK